MPYEKTPIKIKSKYFKPTTGMSYYDGMLEQKKYTYEEKGIKAYIRYMTPREYILEIVNSPNYDATFDEYIEEKTRYRTKEYALDMKKGDKFAFPVLEYEGEHVVEQEGAHRALAVMHLNPKHKMPVGVFLKKKGKEWKGFFR